MSASIALCPLQEAAFQAAVDAQINGYFVAFEMSEKNAQGLTRWRLKLAQDEVQPDACHPNERTLYARWYAMRLDLARRWLFKRRAARRAEALPGWGEALYNDSYSMLMRKPAG